MLGCIGFCIILTNKGPCRTKGLYLVTVMSGWVEHWCGPFFLVGVFRVNGEGVFVVFVLVYLVADVFICRDSLVSWHWKPCPFGKFSTMCIGVRWFICLFVLLIAHKYEEA